MERDNKKDLFVTLSVFFTVSLIVSAVVVKHKRTDFGAVPSTSVPTSGSVQSVITIDSATTTPVTTTPTTIPASSSSGYKDGPYTATAEYYTPGQPEEITVKVTIKDGIVTDTTASATQYDRDSRVYSNAFVESYQPYVVGKSLASIKLSRVSGASLTSQGFNDAIATIRAQAKV